MDRNETPLSLRIGRLAMFARLADLPRNAIITSQWPGAAIRPQSLLRQMARATDGAGDGIVGGAGRFGLHDCPHPMSG